MGAASIQTIKLNFGSMKETSFLLRPTFVILLNKWKFFEKNLCTLSVAIICVVVSVLHNIWNYNTRWLWRWFIAYSSKLAMLLLNFMEIILKQCPSENNHYIRIVPKLLQNLGWFSKSTSCIRCREWHVSTYSIFLLSSCSEFYYQIILNLNLNLSMSEKITNEI